MTRELRNRMENGDVASPDKLLGALCEPKLNKLRN
jgi:hypothetical protein